MYVTVDQDHILRVLEQTGCLTVTQAHRLLRISNPKSQESYARRILNQLQHIQRARLKTDDTFVPPHLIGKPVDGDMLAAVDVMLDLAGDSLLDLSARTPPFKLCFLAGRGETLSSYGIIPVREGQEPRICSLLEKLRADQRTIIFLLDSMRQATFKTTLPHYFAVREHGRSSDESTRMKSTAFDGGRYRYFKGE